MNKRAPRAEVQYASEWRCKTCEETEPRTRDSMRDHLMGTHGLKDLAGSRITLLHLDMADRYTTTYGWKFDGDVEVVQDIVGPRGRGSRR